MTVAVEVRGFKDLAVAEAFELRDDDLGASNSKAAPERIKPAALAGVRSERGKISLRLAPASWNLIALAPALPTGAKT